MEVTLLTLDVFNESPTKNNWKGIQAEISDTKLLVSVFEGGVLE
jgi:hypothetical protein